MDVHFLNRYLDTNGDGTGTKAAIGNYAGAAESFYIEPGDGYDFVISRMLVTIQDSGVMNADDYGFGGALTNGVAVRHLDVDQGVKRDLLDGLPIKSHAMWGQVCYDMQETSFGTGDKFVQVRWTFSKSGIPIVLKTGERLEVLLNDDLTKLTGHTFVVQGYAMDNEYQNLGGKITRP